MATETESLRVKIHEDFNRSRQLQRTRQRDTLRCGLVGMQEESADNVNQSEVLKLCNRIKRKKAADSSDLFRLSNGFLHSVANVEAFLKTPGALNVLIKELTGSSGDKQVLAAETICNLSLGDSSACLKVTKQIATYLLTIIESQNLALAETGLWTLYNLIAESDKTQELFFDQGMHLKLMKVLGGNVDPILKAESTRCLSVVIRNLPLKEQNIPQIKELSLDNWTPESPRLIYEILEETEYQLQQEDVDKLIRQILDESQNLSIGQQIYRTRILGNLFAKTPSESLLRVILSTSKSFVTAMNRQLQSAEELLQRETLWCLGNLSRVTTGNPQFETDFLRLIAEELRVPKMPWLEFSQYAEGRSTAGSS